MPGVALAREIDQQAWAIEALAGLAHIALIQGRLDEALSYSSEILTWLDHESIAGMTRPMLVYLTAHRVLASAGETERAQQLLFAAYRLVADRVVQLDDEHSRRMFLETVPEHRETVSIYSGMDQVTARLLLAEAPTGRPLRDDEYVTITWTVVTPEDQTFVHGPARRQVRLRRLLQEAANQGAAPTVSDLAAVLEVSEPTVRRDLAALRRAGHPVQTRGSRGG